MQVASSDSAGPNKAPNSSRRDAGNVPMNAGATALTNATSACRCCAFAVGQWVETTRRKWAGINQEGGVGRVTAVQHSATLDQQCRLTVRYVLDGRVEQDVSVEYAKPYQQEQPSATTTTLSRRRLGLRQTAGLGRCTYCGSLRVDCQSCDLRLLEQEQQQSSTTATTSHKRPPKRVHSSSRGHSEEAKERSSGTSSDHSSDNSSKSSGSSSEEDWEKDLRKQERNYRRYQRWKKQYQQPLESSCSDDDSSFASSVNRTETCAAVTKRTANTSIFAADSSDDESSSSDDELIPLEALALPPRQRKEAIAKRKNVDKSKKKSRQRSPTKAKKSDRTLPESTATTKGVSGKNRKRRRHLPSSLPPDSLAAVAEEGFAASRSDDDDDSFMSPALDTAGGDDSESSDDVVVLGSSRMSHSLREDAPEETGDSHSLNEDAQAETGDDFIQPEGAAVAEELPTDIQDRTKQLSFAQLAPFFDDTANTLEYKLIPAGRQRFVELELEWRRLLLKETGALDEERVEQLLSECDGLGQQFIRQLKQEALDQCRSALRKLSDTRQYRLVKSTLSKEERHACRGKGKMEAREFRWDALDQSVEEIISKTRTLNGEIRKKAGKQHLSFDGGEEANQSMESEDDWVNPFQEGSFGESQLPAVANSPMIDGSEPPLADALLSPLDPHVHASKKSRPIMAATGRDGAQGRRTKKQKSNSSRNVTRSHRPPKRAATSEPTVKRRKRKKGRAVTRPTSGSESSVESQSESRDKSVSSGDEGLVLSGAEPSTRENQLEKKNRSNRAHTGVRGVVTSGRRRRRSVSASVSTFLMEQQRLDRNAPRHDRSSSRRNDRVPVADRMQLWLEKNQDSQLDVSDTRKRGRGAASTRSSGTQQTSGRGNAQDITGGRRRQPSSRHGMRETIPSTDGNDGPLHPVSAEYLGSLLSNSDRSREASASSRTASLSLEEHAVEDLCQKLVDSFPSSDSQTILETFVVGARDSHFSKHQATLIFRSLLAVLQNGGTSTLQELISSESSVIKAHTLVLATLLRLLRLKLNEELVEEDGHVYRLFSKASCQHFVSFVFVQTVESVFSLVHQGWGLKLKRPRLMLRALDDLRDSFCDHFNLLGRTCRCIEQELGVPRWRCNDEHVFVSSVDPESWANYLRTAVPPPAPRSLRKTLVDKEYKQLPRCEIEALWCLLSYFALPVPSNVAVADRYPWRLLARMFHHGAVLRVLQDGQSGAGTSYPSNGHLEACAAEINKLTSLVSTGALGEVRDDTMLVSLIEMSVKLRAEALVHDVRLRVADFPSMRNEKYDKRRAVKFFDRISDSSASVQLVESTMSAMIRSLTGGTLPEIMGQPQLYASSSIVRASLALLLTWAEQVSSEKARQKRFSDKLLSLTNKLIADAAQLESLQPGRQEPLDPFQLAFSLDQDTCTVNADKGSGSTRKALFLRETAAYVSVVSALSLSRSKAATSVAGGSSFGAVREKAWDILADSDMKARRLSIQSGTLSTSTVYVGDSFRPYLASRVLSFFVVTSLGVLPWTDMLSAAPQVTQDGLFEHLRPDGDDLELVLSCLFTCLECSRNIIEVMASVSHYLGLVLVSVAATHTTAPAPLFPSSCGMLRCFFRTLENSFRFLLTSVSCGPLEDVCLVALLSVLRGLINGRLESEKTLADQAELGGSENSVSLSVPRLTEDHFVGLCDIFVRSLEQAKPSMRYDLVRASGVEVILNAKGRIMIANRSNIICQCLAAIITAVDLQKSTNLVRLVSSLWNVRNRFSQEADQRDISFRKRQAWVSSAHACAVAAADPRRSDVVQGNEEGFFDNLVELLLNPNVLEALPSCNLPRIASNGGRSSEQTEFSRLMKANESERRRGVDLEVWRFCRDFGTLLTESRVDVPLDYWGRVGNLLRQDVDMDYSPEHELLLSVEREHLRRFKLFGGLVTAGQSPERFERLACLLVASTSCQLTALIGKDPRARLDDGDVEPSYEASKWFELFSCYTELHVWLLALIGRECRHYSLSETFRVMWNSVYNDYLVPILRGSTIDLIQVLRSLASRAGSLYAGDRMPSPQGASVSRSSAPSAPYLDVVSKTILRHSNDFLLRIAYDVQVGTSLWPASLFEALVIAGVSAGGQTALTIARGFGSTDNRISAGPLEDGVDEYLAHVKKEKPLSEEEIGSLCSLKRRALKMILVPRLVQPRFDAVEKAGSLQLIRYMLDAEHDDEPILETGSRLDSLDVCSLAQGLRASLRSALGGTSVDGNVVSTAFLCARSLGSLPSISIDHRAVGWLVNWCGSVAEDAGELGASTSIIHGGYLWYILVWLKELGELMLESRKGRPEMLDQYRKNLNDLQGNGNDRSWPLYNPAMAEIENRISSLESRVFEGTKIYRNITNVYGPRGAAVAANEPIVPWHPDDNVCGPALKAFVAEVSYAAANTDPP